MRARGAHCSAAPPVPVENARVFRIAASERHIEGELADDYQDYCHIA